jgi:hypothetical protein
MRAVTFFSDDQMRWLVEAATPLLPGARSEFLEAVIEALPPGGTGNAQVRQAIAKAQAQFR